MYKFIRGIAFIVSTSLADIEKIMHIMVKSPYSVHTYMMPIQVISDMVATLTLPVAAVAAIFQNGRHVS